MWDSLPSWIRCLSVTPLLVAMSPFPGSAAAVEPAAAVVVDVVAHQDDDLLFMNPDVYNSIRSGRAVKTVYITAGEGGYTSTPGVSAEPSPTVCRQPSFLDRELYARCRQLGAHAAYARMAGVADDWEQNALLISGAWVEIHTLKARRDIQLVFLNLPDWADVDVDVNGNDYRLRGASLYHLWADERGAGTVIPDGSALTSANRTVYQSGVQVVSVLAALYQKFHATLVRIQDYEPDSRYRFNPSWGNDHSDHIVGAKFAQDAVQNFSRSASGATVRVVPYRNYNIDDSQVNLDAEAYGLKRAVFGEYLKFDAEIDAPPTGDYAGWPQRMYYRASTGTTWASRNEDGTVQAFAVEGGQLVTWWQNSDGSFAAPTVLTSPGPLAPGISVARNEDGRLQCFALRTDTNEVVTTWQVSANGEFNAQWTSLGNPNADAGDPAQVGLPIVSLMPGGRLQVFIKNAGGGVSSKVQSYPNAGFRTNWVDLGGGSGVQDGLAVTVGNTGMVSLFAYAVQSGVGRIKYWRARRADVETGAQVFELQPDLPGMEPAGPPRAASSNDGHVEVYYRLARNAQVDRASLVGRTWQRPDGSWNSSTDLVGGHGGVDAIASVDATQQVGSDRRIVLFETNGGSGLSTTKQIGPDSRFDDEWSDLGAVVVGQPSSVVDGDGRIFVFALTDDGRVLVRHQSEPGGAHELSEAEVLLSP
ncbi:PIG-L family deacetylase [Amycolatopsis plumensis]|uniref:PIG-L family deacetylase n=1 Tax=Amycolatopsis plumensis TaxID=236508 RepID=A0ABV5UJ04_9PSEU